MVKAIILRGALGLLILCLLSFVLTPTELTTAAQQPPPIYGYRVDDHYSFAESLTESLDGPDENLLWHTLHHLDVRIVAIRENVAGYFIRVTARVTNFTGGYDDYVREEHIEGYTPIVAGFQNYFTHTEWEIHLIDWNRDASRIQNLFGDVGYREQDLQNRYFHWNYTQYVNASLSIIDIDNDGFDDGYRQYNCYTAQFNSDGVVLVRRYELVFIFDCGFQYTRIRLLEQTLPETSTPLTPASTMPWFIPVFIVIVITACILLTLIVILPRRLRTHLGVRAY
jgi:hypothetical protein